MRKLWTGRKGVSTMIGGIIILTLFLTALTAMVLLSQQYDAYQTTLNAMSQKDVDRFGENLAAIYPGLAGPTSVSGCGGTCNQYNITVSNLSGIGTQIVRIYVNSTTTGYLFYILDPAPTPSPYRFRSYDSFINQGESAHQIIIWLPNGVTLQSNSPNANSISLVTSRGRVFSFNWPFPPAGTAVPTGSTVDVGPFRITLDYNLITYTTITQVNPGPAGCAKVDPSPTPCMSGGWAFPSGNIVFYVRISNIGSSNIILADSSSLIAHQYDAGGSALPDLPFYIVRPMSSTCHDTYFAASYFDPSGGQITGNCPTPSTIAGYNATGSNICALVNPCYNIPNGPALGQPGQEVIVLFSAGAPKGTQPTPGGLHGPQAHYVFFLSLVYLYQGYRYGITFPLLSTTT